MPKERRLLKHIRKCSLWAFLASAVVALVITILETWNVLETSKSYIFDGPQPTFWGRINTTASIVMWLSLLVLLSILIADKAKLGGGKGKVDVAKLPAPVVKPAPKAKASTPAPKAATPAKKPVPKK